MEDAVYVSLQNLDEGGGQIPVKDVVDEEKYRLSGTKRVL